MAGVKRELKHMLEDLQEYGVFEHDGPFAILWRGVSPYPSSGPRRNPQKRNAADGAEDYADVLK